MNPFEAKSLKKHYPNSLVVSLALPEGVMGYKYLASSSSSGCCDPNHPGYLGTKKAEHISSFVEFYQVC